MKKNSPNTDSRQMDLFAPQFGNKIRRTQIDGHFYFSILDVFEHYGSKGSAANPSKYWKRVEERLQKQGVSVSDEVRTDLVYLILEGAKLPTPLATYKFFMRMVQVSEIREWEYLREWMAELAHERVEERLNPELGIERAQDRFIGSKIDQGMSTQEAQDFLILVQEGKVIRRQWTDVLKRVVRGAIYYGTITNAEYEVLFGMTAKQITDATGFKPARNGMTRTGRQFVNLVECALEDAFNQQANLTFAQAVELTKEICAEFSVVINKVESRLGISLATGQKLLGGGR